MKFENTEVYGFKRALKGMRNPLESWRKNHEKFFKEEGRLLGYEFSEDMPVIFEEFEVVERY